jgi:hypothetical protein
MPRFLLLNPTTTQIRRSIFAEDSIKMEYPSVYYGRRLLTLSNITILHNGWKLVDPESHTEAVDPKKIGEGWEYEVLMRDPDKSHIPFKEKKKKARAKALEMEGKTGREFVWKSRGSVKKKLTKMRKREEAKAKATYD